MNINEQLKMSLNICRSTHVVAITVTNQFQCMRYLRRIISAERHEKRCNHQIDLFSNKTTKISDLMKTVLKSVVFYPLTAFELDDFQAKRKYCSISFRILDTSYSCMDMGFCIIITLLKTINEVCTSCARITF